MVDLNNILQGLSKSGAISGFAGGLAGTALAGTLSGKKGRKVASSALKIGGLAAVGALAYNAYQRYRQSGAQAGSGAPATAEAHGIASRGAHGGLTAGQAETPRRGRWDDIDRERFEAVTADTQGPASTGLLLVRAMIAAAAADGHMDSGEQERIFRETQRLDLSPEEKAVLFDELRHPMSLQQLVARVPNSESAIEVYAASLVAIDETRAEGRSYLDELAAALNLPGALVASLHEQADAVRHDEAA